MLAQLCPTHGNPRDCSLPGSSVYRILQARIPEWVAISSTRGYSQPSDWTCISCVYICFKFSFCLVCSSPNFHSFPLTYNFLPFSPSIPPHSLKLRLRVRFCKKLCPTNDILFVYPLQNISTAQAVNSCLYLFACLSHPWLHSFNLMYLTPNTTLKTKEVKQISE